MDPAGQDPHQINAEKEHQKLFLIKYYCEMIINILIQDFVVLGLFSLKEIRNCTAIFKTSKLKGII